MDRKELKLVKEQMFDGEKAIFVELTGRAPGLLMNSPKAMLWEKKGKKVGDNPSPEDEAESKCYRMENDGGELYVPSQAIKGCLIASAGAYKIGKKSAAGLMAGTVRVYPAQLGLGTKEYEIDIQTVVNPATRGRVLRARPLLRDWTVEFVLVYDPTFGVTSSQLQQMIVEGGRRIGLLDFRPQKKGPYGTFTVTKWEELKL